MRDEWHRASGARPSPVVNVSSSLTCCMDSRARPYAEGFRGGGQVDVSRFARLHGIDERDIDGRCESHVLGDVHAFAPASPGPHLLGAYAQRLRGVGLVAPPVKPEGGFEQGHGAEALLPACFLSFWRPRVLVSVRDGARVGEDGALEILERDAQERRDPHHLVERRLADPTELPPLDRAGTDPDQLAKPRTRVARLLATLLQQPGNRRLFDRHRLSPFISGSTVIRAYPRIYGGAKV